MRLGEVNDRRAVSCGLQNEKYLRRLAFRIDRFGQWQKATLAFSFLKNAEALCRSGHRVHRLVCTKDRTPAHLASLKSQRELLTVKQRQGDPVRRDGRLDHTFDLHQAIPSCLDRHRALCYSN